MSNKLSQVKQQLQKHPGFQWFWNELKTRNTDEKFIHCSRYLNFISEEDAEMLMQRLNSILENLLFTHSVDFQKMLDITADPVKMEIIRLRRALSEKKELSDAVKEFITKSDNLLDL